MCGSWAGHCVCVFFPCFVCFEILDRCYLRVSPFPGLRDSWQRMCQSAQWYWVQLKVCWEGLGRHRTLFRLVALIWSCKMDHQSDQKKSSSCEISSQPTKTNLDPDRLISSLKTGIESQSAWRALAAWAHQTLMRLEISQCSLFQRTTLTLSLAAKARMSAQETTPGQAASSFCLAMSMTS